ncbi:MAG: DUF2207 domain-containing protein [Treponema sp.]|nr:DUF2207 domain-containing protein [Treponema sp.]
MNKKLKKILSLFLFCFILGSPVFADLAGYTIKDYNYEATVYENNVLEVTESILVNFSEPRHGIYRSIPTSFYLMRQKEEDGQFFNMRYLEKVTDVNTYQDKNSTSSEEYSFDIKIGDANKTITGDHLYTITYNISFPEDRTKLGDFFYLSTLGTEWATTVDNFSYKVTFDKGIPNNTQFEIYSGELGSSDNPLGATIYHDGVSVWGTAKNIGENQGVTLFAELPEGYYVGARKLSPFLCWLFSISAIALLIYIIFRILTTDQKKPVQTVEFYPPNNITPADVGFIIDNSADDSDFTALIPFLAQKGYLSITEEEKTSRFQTTPGLEIKKIKDIEAEKYPDYVNTFFDYFSKNESLNTSNIPSSFLSTIDEAKKQLQKSYTEERALYKNADSSKSLLFISCLLSFLAIAASSAVSRWDNLICAIPVALMYIAGAFFNNRQFTKRFSKKKKILRNIIFVTISIFMVLFALDEARADLNVPFILLIINFILLIPVCLFNGRIIQLTEFNCEMTGKLLGLKEFIKVAELPKLKVLMQENPNYYYDVLPYAMVFGLANKWTKQFNDIPIVKPSWYYSTGNTLFDVTSFDKAITSSITSSVDSARAAASSHSSGGGGHSGGGGGGGGGGSW